jgi:hypothetical protein
MHLGVTERKIEIESAFRIKSTSCGGYQKKIYVGFLPTR